MPVKITNVELSQNHPTPYRVVNKNIAKNVEPEEIKKVSKSPNPIQSC